MKVRCEHDDFTQGFKWVHSSVGNAGYIAALTGVLAVAEEGKLTLSTTDVENAATVVLPAAIDEPGRTLIPRRFAQAIARFPDAPVSLTVGDRLTLACGRTEVSAALLPVEDFPGQPSLDGVGVALPAGTVERVAKSIAPFVAKQSDRAFLLGVGVRVRERAAWLYASDSYRMARLVVECEPQAEVEAVVPPQLFATGVEEMLVVGEGHAGLVDDERTASTALIDAAYPFDALDKGWGPTQKPRVTVERDALLGALGRVEAVIGREGANNKPTTRLVASDGQLELSASHQGEQVSDAIEAFAEDEWSALVNPTFLASLVKAHDADDITLAQEGRNKPIAVLGEDASLSTLFMPITEE